MNWVTHMIRAPIGRSTPSPTASTTPVASWPDVNGSGGVSGYVPRHMNTSGSPIPAAVTRMRTSPGPGTRRLELDLMEHLLRLSRALYLPGAHHGTLPRNCGRPFNGGDSPTAAHAGSSGTAVRYSPRGGAALDRGRISATAAASARRPDRRRRTRSRVVRPRVDGNLRIEKHGSLIATVVGAGCVRRRDVVAARHPRDRRRRRRRTIRCSPSSTTRARCSTVATGLPLALARLLARRLQVMTTYLADIKQQYADHEGGLGMVDTVLGTPHADGRAPRSELGSERDPDPEY